MSYTEKSNFLTVVEVARLLRLSILTIYKYIREQKLKALEFGGHYRIEKSSLEEFINDHRVVKPRNQQLLSVGTLGKFALSDSSNLRSNERSTMVRGKDYERNTQ